MMVHSVPAAYLPYVHAAVRRVVNEIHLDSALREDEDTRVRELASVPESEIRKDVAGEVHIIITE